MAKNKLKDYVGFYTETEGREECLVTINPQLSVAAAMVNELDGTKLVDLANTLLRDYYNERIADIDARTLAEFSQRGKKTDAMAKQAARLIMAEKIIESIDVKLPGAEDEQEQKSA